MSSSYIISSFFLPGRSFQLVALRAVPAHRGLLLGTVNIPNSRGPDGGGRGGQVAPHGRGAGGQPSYPAGSCHGRPRTLLDLHHQTPAGGLAGKIYKD